METTSTSGPAPGDPREAAPAGGEREPADGDATGEAGRPAETGPTADRSTDGADGPPPRILTRGEHCISRRDFAPEALAVLQRLRSKGFKAYLVGGAVRDHLLGKEPKDYDVATDARPSRLKKLFRNCRIIGRRFRIAHVIYPSGRIIEVATFRRNASGVVRGESGIILRDNEYGTPRQDALRRDLTINGLFYDISSFSVIDWVGGVDDLRSGVVRTISPPETSFREDPVRMVRALRHAARTGFTVEPRTLEAIYAQREEISLANPSRLLEEVFRDLRGGAARPFFRSAVETHLLDQILPDLARQLRDEGPEHPFWRRSGSLDRRTREGEEMPNAVLLAILLHTVLFPEPAQWAGEAANPPDVWRHVTGRFRSIPSTIRVSRQDTERVAQILICFRKLVQALRRGRLPPPLAPKRYLADALTFLEIELESRGESTETPRAWREQAEAARSEHAEWLDDSEGSGQGDTRGTPSGGQRDRRRETAAGDPDSPPRRRRRRGRRRKKRRPSTTHD